MTSSTPRAEAFKTFPILPHLCLTIEAEDQHNLELDIEDGKLVLKQSDTPYKGTPLERIQEIAIQFKILCSTILGMERNGEKLYSPLLATNIRGARDTLLDRVEDLKKNPELNGELRQTESILRRMQMPPLPTHSREDKTITYAPQGGDIMTNGKHSTPPRARRALRPRTFQSLPPKAPGIQPYQPLPVYSPRKSAALEEIKAPTKESLTAEIYQTLQSREKIEESDSSSSSIELKSRKAALFKKAVENGNISYIQQLHEEEADPSLKDSLYRLLFKLNFPEID